MKIGLLPIISSLHDENKVNDATKNFIREIEKEIGYELKFIDFSERDNYDLVLVFVETGGSENQFKLKYKELKAPYLILTYGENNSLAASLEILTFIKENKLEGEVLHGSVKYIGERIKYYLKDKKKFNERLGVLGKPSDWLIASDVDYEEAKKLYGIELVNISLDNVMKYYNDVKSFSFDTKDSYKFNKEELTKSYKMAEALYKVKEEYKLDGLTIRCFDLIGPSKTTGCMALALLNKDGITATCEGDIPTMMTMHVCNKLFGCPGFQANPSRIDVDKNEIIFAHCTIPLNMISNTEIMTHFESNTGVAIRGKLKKGPITIFKIGPNLKDYAVLEGDLVENLEEPNLCRTQVRIKLDDDVKYFLTNPLGNHHVIIYGHHRKEIDRFFKE